MVCRVFLEAIASIHYHDSTYIHYSKKFAYTFRTYAIKIAKKKAPRIAPKCLIYNG